MKIFLILALLLSLTGCNKISNGANKGIDVLDGILEKTPDALDTLIDKTPEVVDSVK